MRILVPTALLCLTILVVLLLAKLHVLQVTYVTYLDIAKTASSYCTAASNNYQEFAKCVKLIDPRLVPESFKILRPCFSMYNLEICYIYKIGIVKVGHLKLNTTTYMAVKYVDFKVGYVRRGSTYVLGYNVTMIVSSDTYTSLLVPKNCTYVITGQGYVIRCTVPALHVKFRICDTRGLCISIRTSG